MALAGPASNLALCALATTLLFAGRAAGFFLPASVVSFDHLVDGGPLEISVFAGTVLSILFSLNILLAIFNLIPLPPLDGAAATTLLLPETLAAKWRQITDNPQFRVVGLLVAWQVAGPICGTLYRTIAREIFLR